MTVTIAFDVYGTLINTHGVVAALQDIVGDKATHFSIMWRDKQLEYSFRRGLMNKYADFSVCTRDALNFTCAHFDEKMSDMQKQALLDVYKILPAFEDVSEGLNMLNDSRVQGYAFSNGSANAVEKLLETAGIRSLFDGVISVEALMTFKPNPNVYHYFLEKSGAKTNNAWLVSSNPFDVIGALSVGMKAAWVQRSNDAIFDPWGIEPTVTVKSLIDLDRHIRANN